MGPWKSHTPTPVHQFISSLGQRYVNIQMQSSGRGGRGWTPTWKGLGCLLGSLNYKSLKETGFGLVQALFDFSLKETKKTTVSLLFHLNIPLIDCFQPSFFIRSLIMWIESPENWMHASAKWKTSLTNPTSTPTPVCFGLATLTFSFACINREAMNSLIP